MTFAKAITLLTLAAIWVVVGLAAAFFTMPLWGMSIDGPYPWWVTPGITIWIVSYVALAVAVIRSKELP
jgi:uncharacterized membrane protein